MASSACKKKQGLICISCRANGVPNRLIQRFSEPSKFADVKVNQAMMDLGAFARNQFDLGLDNSGIADETTARLDYSVRNVVAEMALQRTSDRLAISCCCRHVLQVSRRKAAAEINHGQIDAALAQLAKNARGRMHRHVPSLGIELLRADVE